MSRDQLLALHELATEARDCAYRAYETALKNRKVAGDTQAAYETLLNANQVRDRIYVAVLALAVAA